MGVQGQRKGIGAGLWGYLGRAPGAEKGRVVGSGGESGWWVREGRGGGRGVLGGATGTGEGGWEKGVI